MSQLQVNRINDASGGVLAPISSVMRNRLINGQMTIDQRNNGAAISAANLTGYTVDRWSYTASQTSKYTAQQNQGSVTPPAGFTNYLGFTSQSAFSPASTDFTGVFQAIEGFNWQDLGFGTANAKTITVSFWVRSSLTGTFSGALRVYGSSRSYPFSYTVNAANTWEYETITIAGDTGGTYNTGNNGAVLLTFNLGSGSNFLGTGGAWTASNLFGTTGSVNIAGTNGATFYITGVQLEVGTQATSFEYRQYGTELALCQRYYQFVGGEAAYQFVGSGMNYAANSSSIQIPILVRFRAIPSIGVSSVSHWAITYASGAQAVSTSITDDQSGTTTVNVGVAVTGTPLTNGGAAKLIATNTLSARITMSAEL
jgi:hypothetical protein